MASHGSPGTGEQPPCSGAFAYEWLQDVAFFALLAAGNALEAAPEAAA